MREGLLSDANEYASKPLIDHLKRRPTYCALHHPIPLLNVYLLGSAVKANQVFLPVLENSAKAQRLRTTLSVFERSKFFFSLPGSLAESIEAVSGRTVSLRCDCCDQILLYAGQV